MDENTEPILNANHSFYVALSLADFKLMERVWLASPEAVCTHPGWPALHGWESIRESWRQIFENQGPLHVWPSEVELRLYGHTAEISCLENIDMAQVRGHGVLRTRATNIFRLVQHAWKVLEHHALPMPGGALQPLDPFTDN